jgi:hypothetical protein
VLAPMVPLEPGSVRPKRNATMPRISSVFAISTILVPGLLCQPACSSSEASGGKGGAAAFSGAGAGSTGAAGTSAVTGGAPNIASAGTASTTGGASDIGLAGSLGVNVGGSSGTSGGGSSTAGATGASTGGASAGGSDGGAAGINAGGSGGAAGSSGVPANFFMRYEAESPLNMLTYPVEGLGTEGDSACAADAVKEGANCASGGKVVNQILGRSPCTPPTSTTSYTQCQNKGGGVQFNAVTVPVDGSYDVTWWYHCGPDTPGHADVYGDTKCGGLNYDTGAGSGCRPHMIDVNGAPMSSTVGGKTALYYQFPCYPAPWSTLHGATTVLPLKAGSNTIYIHAPGATTLDAADMDALDVQPEGHGTAPAPLWPKLVTPVVAPN